MHGLAMKLCGIGVDIEQEEDTAQFIGVNLERDKEIGILKMKQPGLIECVISAVGLDKRMDKGNYTPAGSVPLVNSEYGVRASDSYNHRMVVLMRIYISDHTRPNNAFAVNYCARYIFWPKNLHEEALKKNGRYLKLTRDYGLILNPNRGLFKIDSYPDADFSVMYGHDNPTDPACFKISTGYVITFSDCSILWQSKIQIETYLLTKETIFLFKS